MSWTLLGTKPICSLYSVLVVKEGLALLVSHDKWLVKLQVTGLSLFDFVGESNDFGVKRLWLRRKQGTSRFKFLGLNAIWAWA